MTGKDLTNLEINSLDGKIVPSPESPLDRLQQPQITRLTTRKEDLPKNKLELPSWNHPCLLAIIGISSAAVSLPAVGGAIVGVGCGSYVKKAIFKGMVIGAIAATGLGLQKKEPELLPIYSVAGAVVGYAAGKRFEGNPAADVTILEGARVDAPRNQQKKLEKLYPANTQTEAPPRLEIGGQQLPKDLEALGFFVVGSPGSGKTQSIKLLLDTLRQREDYRVMVLDRGGELMENFFAPDFDKLANPFDRRSIFWSHKTEGVSPKLIAKSLIPENIAKEKFWHNSSRSLHEVILEKAKTNEQVWDILTKFPLERIKYLVKDSQAARYLENPKNAVNILSAYVDNCAFYQYLPNSGEPFSFFNWGAKENPSWLWLPIFEDCEEHLRNYYTMAFELAIKGLLRNANRDLKTAFVIDELGALNQLPSLKRLLSESRKFGGTAILGTQSIAQVREVYGQEQGEILLQNTKTKLILNCADPETATKMADVIGKQLIEEKNVSFTRGNSWQWQDNGGLLGAIFSNGSSRSKTVSKSKREQYAVMPASIQDLLPLEGYLRISGVPTSLVRVTPYQYLKLVDSFEPFLGMGNGE